jgi:hypothetical protein
MQLPLVRKSCSDNEELIFIWRFFQLRCLPSIVFAKYAWHDSIKAIKANKNFYKHENKKIINEVGKALDTKVEQLMSAEGKYKDYIGEYCDTIEELLDKEIRIFDNSIKSKLKGAFIEDVDFYSALFYVQGMLSLAFLEYCRCFKDIITQYNVDVSNHFDRYDVNTLLKKWNIVCEKAGDSLPDKDSKGHTVGTVNFNKGRFVEAFRLLRSKLVDAKVMYKAAEAAYPYSSYYDSSVPFEDTTLAKGLLQSIENQRKNA